MGGDLGNVLPSDSETSATSGSESHSRGTSPSLTSSQGEGVHEPMLWGLGLMGHEEQQAAAVHQSLKMSHEHHQRRLLSQRRLAHPEVARVGDSYAFLLRLEHLAKDDAVLLQTFSNGDFFKRLLELLETPQSAGSGRNDVVAIDEILYRANPLFREKYAILMRTNQLNNDDRGPGSAKLARISEYAEEEPSAQAMTSSWQPVSLRKRAARGRDSGTSSTEQRSAMKRQRKDKKVSSTSLGLVAQSMQEWEKHLEAELVAEGETVDSFRQGKSKSSYVEKEQFQREAQWNEFLREKALEDQQRELAAKRAIRRGEVDP
ncbi:unnamed protein product [Phytomonas sp. EM1]|nr:unnamed protein product [Phytomonas sp. EM1]|eukprot:CCW65373.1 unnamed protein product [Phytomonas sp. isolate EM1]